jgi:sulfate permease, SulP family
MAWNISEMKVFVNSLRINIYEALVLLVTFVLTLATDLTISIPIGFVLSLILFMKRMADSTDISPLLSVKADNDMLFSSEIGEYSENITIYEMNGPMFFGSAHMLLRIKKNETYNAQVIILRFRYVPIMDTSALHRLKDLVRELKKIHCEVVISGANERIARKLLQSGIIVPENLLPTIQEAAVRGKKLLDKMKTT